MEHVFKAIRSGPQDSGHGSASKSASLSLVHRLRDALRTLAGLRASMSKETNLRFRTPVDASNRSSASMTMIFGFDEAHLWISRSQCAMCWNVDFHGVTTSAWSGSHLRGCS